MAPEIPRACNDLREARFPFILPLHSYRTQFHRIIHHAAAYKANVTNRSVTFRTLSPTLHWGVWLDVDTTFSYLQALSPKPALTRSLVADTTFSQTVCGFPVFHIKKAYPLRSFHRSRTVSIYSCMLQRTVTLIRVVYFENKIHRRACTVTECGFQMTTFSGL